MPRLDYNPFNKSIDNLEASDLAVLRDVAEGWYIEYKSQLISPNKVAKSLCSFANHYGGWLFFGVEESDQGDKTAGAFPGLPIKEAHQAEEQIRNAARDRMNPTPFYETKVLPGPVENLNLLSDRVIVVVVIPQGINPPYIHSSGRIYRRIADSSDPKPETDRAILDQLWDRGEKSRNRLAEFVTQEPVLSESEKDAVMMHLTVTSDPYGESANGGSLSSFDDFAQRIQQEYIPFDNIYPMGEYYVARQVANNDPSLVTLTWRFYRNSSSLVTLPIASKYFDDGDMHLFLSGYDHSNEFIKILSTSRYRTVKVLDINILAGAIGSILAIHRSLVGQAGIGGPYYMKANLSNIWRCIPFLDTPEYLQFIHDYGVPLIQHESCLAPPGIHLESFNLIEATEPQRLPLTNDDFMQGLEESILFLCNIFNALGIPVSLIQSSAVNIFANAWERAKKVYSSRSI